MLGLVQCSGKVAYSEVLDSRFTKSRTGVSLSPGQLAQFGHRCLVVVQSGVISVFSVPVKRGAGRVLRMLSPSSVIRCALCTRRSRISAKNQGAARFLGWQFLPVQTQQQCCALRPAQDHRAALHGWPVKPPTVEPFCRHNRAGSIMTDQLDLVSRLVAEDKHITGTSRSSSTVPAARACRRQ